MRRGEFSREFEIEAVRLARERGIGIVQTGRDLDLREDALCKRVRQVADDPQHPLPGMAG
jgi:transposase